MCIWLKALSVSSYNRGWFYHKEHRLWFIRVPNIEPLVKTNTYERGSYHCFDPNTFETIRKVWTDQHKFHQFLSILVQVLQFSINSSSLSPTYNFGCRIILLSIMRCWRRDRLYLHTNKYPTYNVKFQSGFFVHYKPS